MLRPASLYAHEHESVIVPVTVAGLASRFEALGRTWARKRELHVTAIASSSVAEQLGVAIEEVWPAIVDLAARRSVGEIAVGDELRLVTTQEQTTLVVMVSVEGFDELYAALNARLGAALAPPPAHITLYTDPPGAGGVGLHSERHLRGLTRVLTAEEALAVRAHMGWDAVF